ncbi:MAG TPA: tetratricopeptide repeat protein [Rhizomicrobium sp.]|jgi:cytochrome c-type biogenesis protein CcmH
MVPILILSAAFALLAAIALAFVLWPLLRGRGHPPRKRALMAAACAGLLLVVGGAAYLDLGSPQLAQRALSPPEAAGMPGLIARLSLRMRQQPHDATGWMLLGRGYMSLSDPGQAAEAFRRAALVGAPAVQPEALAAEGEALTLAANGTVTPEAEQAFGKALARDPNSRAARFYLGQAYAARRDNVRALKIWNSLLADTSPNAPWRAELVDHIALLTAQSGGNMPDPRAMVAALAARLQSHPEDPEGWQRLIRAYAVLGDRDKAATALAQARIALKDDAESLATLNSEAKVLKLVR